MIFSCVYLLLRGTHTRSICSCNHKQVFGDESRTRIGLHDFDMGEPLPVRANLVLALYNHHSPIPKDAVSLDSRVFVKGEDGFVVFSPMSVGVVIAIVALEWGLPGVGCPAGGVHIRRIEHNAINGTIGIWEHPAIRPRQNVGWQDVVLMRRHPSPKNPFAEGYISDGSAALDVQIKNLGEHRIVVRGV